MKTKFEHLFQLLSADDMAHIQSMAQTRIFGGTQKHTDFLKQYLQGNYKIPKNIPVRDRQLMSDLYQMAEKWLVIKSSLQDSFYQNSVLLKYYREQENEKLFDNYYAQVSKEATATIKNGQYFRHSGNLLYERWQFDQLKSRFSNADAERILENNDIALISQQLMLTVQLIPQLSLISKKINTSFIDQIEPFLLEKNYLQYPCIALYYYTLKMIQHPEDATWFEKFSHDLEFESASFSEEELKNLYFQAINYCIRKHNSGDRSFSIRLLEYYKKALAGGFLLINGYLSRNTYRNINTIALRIGLDQEAEEISQNYSHLLRPKDKKSAFQFNMANILYYRKSYKSALEALRFVDFDDHLSNLFAKTLMLKIYYETKEIRLLDAHLDAMKIYLMRKKDIGYHKDSYDKIVKYTRKLVSLAPYDKEGREKLRLQVQSEKALPDKEWLLRQL